MIAITVVFVTLHYAQFHLDESMSQVHIISSYVAREQRYLAVHFPSLFQPELSLYWYYHVCNNCNTTPDSGFQSNFSNTMW